ncbi:MAG: complex I subunit 1 family protein [Candidatus Ratteibacteria bacterium]|jgi:NADH-quinone oxidoreductase subunit H
MLHSLFLLLIFPGFLFLSVFGTYAEFVDRRLYARLQNRVGPPWFQPLADFIKLLAKEDIVPECAVPGMFRIMPIFALAATTTAFFYLPVWSTRSLYPFPGDVIVVLYLLTIPTITFFLGGWYSTSLFARIGSARGITQLFAYEVPLFMSILAAALLANTWSLTDITLFYSQHPSYAFFNIIGFVVSLLALLGKLEKTPFDIPEAETEIVAGSFTEYSGRLFALFHLTIDIEMVVGAALLAAVFLPFGLTLGPIIGFILFIIKVLFVVGLMALIRTIVARLRIDQMINFCWKFMAPLALLQILINLVLKGVL